MEVNIFQDDRNVLGRQCSVRFLRVFYAQYWKSAPNPSVCRRQSEEQDPCLVALQ